MTEPKVKSYTFVFENCETVTLNAEDVKYIYLSNINETIDLLNEGNEIKLDRKKVASKANIGIPVNVLSNHYTSIGMNDKSLLERFMIPDLVSVTINFSNGEVETVEVFYDNEVNESFNKAQISEIVTLWDSVQALDIKINF